MQKIFETERTLTITSPRYDLGGGPIRSFIVKAQEGSLVVVSPPIRFTENEFTEIEKMGNVSALIASNKFHFLGIPTWKERFPNAKIYSSELGVLRLEKKLRGTVLNVEQLEKMPDAYFFSCPGTRNGEILVVVKEAKGWVWFVTDLFFNFVELPKKWFPRIMVQKGPGLGVALNPFCRFLFIQDKTKVREWLLERLSEFPPQTIVFSHGDPIDRSDLIARFRAEVERY